MLYFLLYQNNIRISENDLKLVVRDIQEDYKPVISFSIRNYLNNTKQLICEYSQQWDAFKKYTNPYD